MDVKNGDILSLISLPDYNLNKRISIKDDIYSNKITLGVYELGSVFKTFTIAAALENKVINQNNLCSYTNTGVTTTASYNSSEAANDYLNSVEWRKPDGTISMSPSDFGVSYSVVGPVLELMMLREERDGKRD